jgi:hypothetical protein
MHLKCSLHENFQKFDIHGASIYSTVEGTFFGFFFSIEKIVKEVSFLYKKGTKKDRGCFHTIQSLAVERKITSTLTPI